LDGDTKDLLARITTLQSGKWALEARVNHLEQSNAALAEDLLQKTAVIQHYFVANKADHSEPLKEPSSSPETSRSALSPSKIMQRITGSKSSEVDHLKDVVGKLQRSLEEALMKNIHLQQVCNICCPPISDRREHMSIEFTHITLYVYIGDSSILLHAIVCSTYKWYIYYDGISFQFACV
jgi:hypothetical protein